MTKKFKSIEEVSAYAWKSMLSTAKTLDTAAASLKNAGKNYSSAADKLKYGSARK
ncbi:TPA: hypothetical protein L3302_003310 [Vibrio cholerae]|nr:hypothetical protein [Vibrio cholerae]HBN6897410.1 hypothetical protein [Vibrio cholerae]